MRGSRSGTATGMLRPDAGCKPSSARFNGLVAKRAFYEFFCRRFYADPSKRGAYANYCGAVGWAKRAEQSAARVPTMMAGCPNKWWARPPSPAATP
jgi:hypothetical protein